MSAASDSSSVPLPEFVRTTTFRWAIAVATMFAVYMLVLFAVIYWRTGDYLTARSDAVVSMQAHVISVGTLGEQLIAIDQLLKQDPRRVQHAGLFAPDGHRVAGNLERVPPELKIDRPARSAVIQVGPSAADRQVVRAVARSIPGGGVLVIGRDVDETVQISEIVGETLALGLLPALGLSVAAGMLLSIRAQRRVAAVNQSVQRIVAGELKERLPVRGVDDPFDRLATIVNGMLERIEALIQDIAGVGDDIAHDLRTPLTRVRVALERGRANARTLEESQAVIDRAIGGLDQSLAIVTALLRIAEIEHTRRLAGFGNVALADLVCEVGDMYEPIADEKHVTLQVHAGTGAIVHGDRDLLLEAVANLVDNAVKFTPEGGKVQVAVLDGKGESIVRVADTGPGISEEERDMVLRRFYRSDRSRNTRGVGLGLSLVAAILKLHGFRLTMTTGPGCVAEIACPHTSGNAQ
jgi:signal transduction histidine kinase